MQRNTRLRNAALATLAVVGLGLVGTYALGSVLHGRSPSIRGAYSSPPVGSVSPAAPAQETAKPTPAPVVGGGQYSPYVGQTYPNRVYWGVPTCTPATPSTRACSG